MTAIGYPECSTSFSYMLCKHCTKQKNKDKHHMMKKMEKNPFCKLLYTQTLDNSSFPFTHNLDNALFFQLPNNLCELGMIHGNAGLFVELIDDRCPANTLGSGLFDDEFDNFTFKVGSGTTHGLTGTGVDEVKINLTSKGISLLNSQSISFMQT